MKISYYSSGITQTEPDRQAEITEILSDIKGLALAAKTKALRAEADPDRQAALKAALPYVTWSGSFQKRSNKDPFFKHSGLLTLDFDDIDPKQTRRKVDQDPYTLLSFISPRGNGLKVVVQIPAEPENHERYFNAAAAHFARAYGIKADVSGNVSRACFLCHDPNLHYNSQAALFDAMREPAVPERPQIELSLDGLESLDPVDRGDYYDLKCPSCGKHDAYMYKNSWVIKCSHLNSCGFEENILEKRIDAKLKALHETPKSKKIRRELYQIIRHLDDIERDQAFKAMGKIVHAAPGAVKRDFENVVQEKAEAEFHADSGIRFAQPDGWQLTANGILDMKRRRVTTQPLYVSALGYARKGGAEYVELVYNSNGASKTRTIPRRSVAIVSDLLDQSDYGVPVTSANALDVVRFLDAWIARNRDAMNTFVAVDQLGWDGDHFIFPDRIIGDTSGEAIHFIESTIDKAAFSKLGSLNTWVEAIRELSTFPDAVVGRFLVYAGFAGLVLEPLNRRPFIIHLHGDTSTSKTTALRMVTSIFGQPIEGKGMIKWNNTTAFVTRYMEKLKNIPLVIDESSSETRNIFEQTIYMMEGGTSKGKALKSDPLGTAPLRTFRCAVFSSGEPPVIKEEDLSGAQVRVIEFDSGPWGGELPREQYEAWVGKITTNYGHAAEAFIEAFIKIKDDYDWESTQKGDDSLTPVENRVKKIVNLIQMCGIVVNELFSFKFDVNKDCERIFEIIKKQLESKQNTAERIMDRVHDFYLENQVNFIETVTDPMTHRITAKPPNSGKVFGYVFGPDLGIIKSVFNDAMRLKLNQPNGGGYAINRLKKSGDISASRHLKQVNGKQESFVYFVNFFGAEEVF